MLVCTERYTFVNKVFGRTKDGLEYLALNVIDKNSKAKLSFMTTNSLVIDAVKEMEFIDFQDVELDIKFSREYNREKKYSYWVAELIDVGKSNRNFE